jgi:replicative DNA helicase
VSSVKVIDFHKAPVSVAEWGEAEPFDVLDVPEFPADALSPWLCEWAHAVAEFTQTPVDLAGVVALSTASLAVCRRFHVEVVVGWTEPTNLYTVTALPPAERKSPVFAKATEPLYAYQRELAGQMAPRIARRETERKILVGQIEQARTAAVKGGGKRYANGGDPTQEAVDLAAQLADLPEIVVPGLVADDCTPEALAVLLGQSGERIGIFSAEGGPFEIMNGRYSEKGANFELFLKCHPGDPHTVHRIRRDPVTLARPLVAMAITVQPHVIQGLAAKEGFRGMGLLARFLFCLPRSIVGRREVLTPAIPEAADRAYHRALGDVLRLQGTERALTLSAEAHQARCDYQQELEPRLGPDGDLEAIRDWAGKLVGTVCRLAGILHVADHADDLDGMPLEIPGSTLDRAKALGDYFLAHAGAAFSAMGADESTELAQRVWKWAKRGRHVQFTASEASRGTHAKPEQVALALLELRERNLVRDLPALPSTGGRPPSPRYEVRP